MKICCVKTDFLPKRIYEATDSFAENLDFIQDEKISWIERGEAENNFDFKQIIPYAVIQKSDGKIACYQRHGTEKRLHGLYSCGFGGHVEEIDSGECFSKTIENGLLRELSEEISNFDGARIELKYLGIINEVKSEVGLVHLGLVFLVKCGESFVPLEADETKGLQWKLPEELSVLQTELWTQLALKLL